MEQSFIELYAEYGAMGIVVALFVYGYIKQSKRADDQADALEALKVENKGQSNDISNIESILDFIDNFNAANVLLLPIPPPPTKFECFLKKFLN